MRLGFHYHIPARIVNGKIYTMSVQGLFLDSLAIHCEKVILFLYKPLESELPSLDYEIQSGNVELVSLVKHYSIPVRLLLNRLVRAKINKRVKDIDILLMRAPTPLLPLITKDIKKKIKFSYLVVGEMADHIDHIPQANWRRGFLRSYILWNENTQQQYAREGFVFANSAVVYNKYKEFSQQSALIRTTTLKQTDFFVREDTCTNGLPYQFLFTGRIERGKGILEIVEAIGMLNSGGIDCQLNIVGWATPGDETPDLINEITTKWGIEDKVIFHGSKKIGEELFSFYRKADIYIIASQVAEGFPRTIAEAMASSLPVISTAVGSIGHFHSHKHDIMLIEPRNPSDIVEKVKELINNPSLRQMIIKNGLQSVQEVTLEVQGKKVIDTLKEYLVKN